MNTFEIGGAGLAARQAHQTRGRSRTRTVVRSARGMAPGAVQQPDELGLLDLDALRQARRGMHRQP